GELRFRPDFQNRRGQDMRRRMPQTFDLRHLAALLWCFAVFVHERRLKLTMKKRKDTKNLWKQKHRSLRYRCDGESNFALAGPGTNRRNRLSPYSDFEFGVRGRAAKDGAGAA